MFSEHLCARHYSKCFIYFTSFKPYNCPFIEEDAGTENLSNFPKITQLLSSRAGIQGQMINKCSLNKCFVISGTFYSIVLQLISFVNL